MLAHSHALAVRSIHFHTRERNLVILARKATHRLADHPHVHLAAQLGHSSATVTVKNAPQEPITPTSMPIHVLHVLKTHTLV